MARGKTIGSMVAVVSATAEQFGADMKKIEGHVSGLKSHVQSAMPAGGIAGMLIGGGAAGVGFGAALAGINSLSAAVSKFFGVLSRSDDLADFAQQIGSTAEEVTGLQFAALQGGSSADVMDTALQKMVQSIGKARASAQGTAPAFEKLGLSVDELSQMTAGEALKAISDRFKDVKNPADQAALAMEIFGRQGVNLVNTLNLGSEGINKLIDRGKEVGAVLENEDVAAAAAASNAIKALSLAWDGLYAQLVVLVLPVLNRLVEWMTEVVGRISRVTKAIREYLGLTSQMAEQTKNTIANSAEGLDEASADIEKATDKVGKWLEDLMRKGARVADEVRTPMEVLEDTLLDLSQLLEVGAIDWQTYERAVAKAADELERATAEQSKASRMSTPGTAAVTRGSREGFSAVQSALRSQQDQARISQQLDKERNAKLDRLLEVNRRALEAQKVKTFVVRGVDI